MKRAATLCIALALAATGCASVKPIESRQVLRAMERNYTLGEDREAAVGEAVVKLKDYPYIAAATVTPDRPCRIRAGQAFDLPLAPGDGLKVIGQRECSAGTCRVVQVPGLMANAHAGAFRIDDSGQVIDAPLNLTANLVMLGTTTAEPQECRLMPAAPRYAGTAYGPYRNFEILYGGMDGGTLRFAYREFTIDDMARPAFSQDFSYPATAAEVKFRDVRIAVREVRPDGLRYRVLADGGAN